MVVKITKIGIIGSMKYTNKDFVYQCLRNNIDCENDIILVGHSSANNFDNVDNWVIMFAKKFCKHKPVIFEEVVYNYTNRNHKIALYSTKIIAFIPEGFLYCDVWITIYMFVKACNKNPLNIVVYGEFSLLSLKNYPEWFKIIKKEYFEKKVE